MVAPRVSPPLTAERARELLTLDPETGFLYWTAAACLGRKTGERAGSPQNGGYRQIKVGKDVYLEHRIVWLLVHGEWPASKLDHKDGVRDHNWPDNLRLATTAQNAQNLTRVQRDTESGLLGVTWEKGSPGRRKGRWVARIRVDGRIKRLGRFDDKHEAHAAYIKAKRELHPFGNL